MTNKGSSPSGLLALSGMPGGWLHVKFFGSTAVDLLAKTVERDGRRIVTTLVVAADPVNSTVFRELPISRVESLANTPEWSASLARFEGEEDPLSTMLSAEIDKLVQVEDQPAAREQPPREPLQRPDGSNPEGFYRKVAQAYSETLLTTSRPAPVLAAEAGVPVATARRWVFESRRRGLLPPGRKGRAG